MYGIYRIAENNIGIRSLFPDVHALCRDYRTDAQPEIFIEVSPADIAAEREQSALTDKREGKPVRAFPDGYLETLAVYRKIAETLIPSDILLFHGSAVAVDGEGYLFTAKSGTGKSTHTSLWMTYFGERAFMVNDDKPLLRCTDGGVIVYGTPWDGKHHRSTNTSVPLKAVCVLERGKENRITPLDRHEAFPLLLQQSYRPSDPALLQRTLALVSRLSAGVKLYRLQCNMELSAAKIAYAGMKGETHATET